MTQDEVKQAKEALDARELEVRRELAVIAAQRKVIQVQCDHKNTYYFTVMGDDSYACRDCGASR